MASPALGWSFPTTDARTAPRHSPHLDASPRHGNPTTLRIPTPPPRPLLLLKRAAPTTVSDLAASAPRGGWSTRPWHRGRSFVENDGVVSAW